MKYYDDPQQAAPVAFCERCGREIYHEDAQLCRRCQEDEAWDG